MKKLIYLLVLIIVVVVLATMFLRQQAQAPTPADVADENMNQTDDLTINKTNMNLASSVFENNATIPAKYTCDGENINPPLTISDVPAQAESLVLIMDDPDAVKPAGRVWDHWVVFNMPTNLTEIAEGTQPAGTPGQGSSGKLEYSGPCPPDAEHRYFFKLYALDSMLDLAQGASKDQVLQALEGHVLAEAELVGLFNRQ